LSSGYNSKSTETYINTQLVANLTCRTGCSTPRSPRSLRSRPQDLVCQSIIACLRLSWLATEQASLGLNMPANAVAHCPAWDRPLQRCRRARLSTRSFLVACNDALLRSCTRCCSYLLPLPTLRKLNCLCQPRHTPILTDLYISSSHLCFWGIGGSLERTARSFRTRRIECTNWIPASPRVRELDTKQVIQAAYDCSDGVWET
jgi:hypothetical protein